MAKLGKSDIGNSPAELRRRIDKASNEHRFQTALDLAKQLYKYEATTANRELLFRIYLGRAGQLRDQGASRDSCTVLENAASLADNDPAKLLNVAEEMVACGEMRSTTPLT